MRHEAAPSLEGIAEGGLALNPLGFGVDVIRNPHTRRAYARAADEFLAWCAVAGVPSIAVVQAVHVAPWIEVGTRELAAPSVKQRLAAIRHPCSGEWRRSSRASRAICSNSIAQTGRSLHPRARRSPTASKRRSQS